MKNSSKNWKNFEKLAKVKKFNGSKKPPRENYFETNNIRTFYFYFLLNYCGKSVYKSKR